MGLPSGVLCRVAPVWFFREMEKTRPRFLRGGPHDVFLASTRKR